MIEVIVHDQNNNLVMVRNYYEPNLTLGEAMERINDYIISEKLNEVSGKDYHEQFKRVKAKFLGACETKARMV